MPKNSCQGVHAVREVKSSMNFVHGRVRGLVSFHQGRHQRPASTTVPVGKGRSWHDWGDFLPHDRRTSSGEEPVPSSVRSAWKRSYPQIPSNPQNKSLTRAARDCQRAAAADTGRENPERQTSSRPHILSTPTAPSMLRCRSR